MTTNNSVNTYIVPTATYEVTMPSQPSFLAYNGSVDLNVTGDGTVATIDFDTEVYDQNADFNGTTTFTSPVDGRYFISSELYAGSFAANHTGHTMVSSSNRDYKLNSMRFIDCTSNGQISLYLASFIDMDAADVVTIELVVSGGAKAIRIIGAANLFNFFSGYLVC